MYINAIQMLKLAPKLAGAEPLKNLPIDGSTRLKLTYRPAGHSGLNKVANMSMVPNELLLSLENGSYEDVINSLPLVAEHPDQYYLASVESYSCIADDLHAIGIEVISREAIPEMDLMEWAAMPFVTGMARKDGVVELQIIDTDVNDDDKITYDIIDDPNNVLNALTENIPMFWYYDSHANSSEDDADTIKAILFLAKNQEVLDKLIKACDK